MLRMLKWIAPTLAVGMFALFTGTVKADDTAPATQPSTQPSGTIVVKVLDPNNNPVVGATVRLMAGGGGHKHAAAAPAPQNQQAGDAPAAPPKHAAPIATGVTDDNGSYTFSGIAPGSYSVNATMRGVGKGRAKVTLAAAADGTCTASVTITLQARAGGNGGNGAPAGGAGATPAPANPAPTPAPQ